MPTEDKTPRVDAAAPNTVFVQVIDRQQRKLVLRRGIAATSYYEYCEEVGCDVWDRLSEIEAAIHEPMGMWLPEPLRTTGTSEYVQGVELATDYEGTVPDGFEMIELPPCQLMIFQGQPFEDERFEDAIGELRGVIERCDPKINGFRWADADAPRFQLIPLGYRGYIEGRPVRPLND